MEARHVSLTIDSRLDSVALVGVAARRVCEEAGFSPTDAAAIELCIVEAVSNSVRHAYRGEAGHSITTRLTLTDQAMEVRVVDEGSPVPLAKRTPPYIDFDPEDPDSIPESGRGIFLIHEIMDRVEYGKEGTANVLLMTKALSTPRE
jgi:serine/threonine-protein kinase RsbW